MTLPITPAQAKALMALRAHAPDVRFVVIGAAAVGHYVKLDRATGDVDLAIVIAPNQLDTLLAPLGWTRHPRMLQRWNGPDGFKADVLPATAELIQAGRVLLDGDSRVMSLLGFDLVLEHAVAAPIHGFTQTVQVASLASLVVLKMVAWLERSHERLKDLGDLATIFEQALSADDDCRWDHAHPVGAAMLQYDQQSPFFVGLRVAEIAAAPHHAQVDLFLDAMRDERRSWCAIMAREAGYAGRDPEGRVVMMLQAFERGLRGSSDGRTRSSVKAR